MAISCLTTRLGRPLIPQEQMFSHSRYLVATTSTFFPLSSSLDRSCVISWINASASLLLLLSLVYICVTIGGQFFKLQQLILFSSEGRAIRLYYSFLPAPPRFSLLDPCHGTYGLFAVSALDKLFLSCLYRLNVRGSEDVLPVRTRTTTTLISARPVVLLLHVKKSEEPAPM